jgi:hypothetical protein
VPDVVPLVPLARLVFIVGDFLCSMHHYITRGCFGSSGYLSHQSRFCQGWAMPNQYEPIRAGCRAVAVCAAWPVGGVGCFLAGGQGQKSRYEMGSGGSTLTCDEFVNFECGEFVFFCWLDIFGKTAIIMVWTYTD